MNSIQNYIAQSFDEVYSMIGGLGMTLYYVPYLEKKFVESRDYINYDFNNKIKINATLNSIETSDVDIEYTKQYLKNTRKGATIQFTLNSISPHKVRPLDRIYIEYEDGRTENYLIVGIDSNVLLQNIYVSVRVYEFDGTLTKFQWADNGVEPA